MTTQVNDFRTARSALLRSTLLLALIAMLAVSCGGPERAPRQKVSGVDRPASQAAPSETSQPEVSQAAPSAPARTGAGPGPDAVKGAAPATPPSVAVAPTAPAGPLDAFLDRAAAAIRSQPGVVAVFPMLSKNAVTNATEVNALGARLSDEIATGLASRGINPLAGAELQNDIRASNRGLSEFRSPADAYWLADRVNATYAVFGTVQKTVYDRMARDEAIDVRLQCIRTGDRNRVAEHRERLTSGPLAVSYARDYARRSNWRIGADAPAGRPSIAQEVQHTVRRVARAVVAKAGAATKGKRVAVDPCVILGVTGPHAGNVQVLTQGFLRALDAAEKKADAAGDPEPRQTAMASGPVTISGTEYPTLEAAYQAIESRRAALTASRAGQLSVDIARTIAAQLRQAGGKDFEVLADDPSRSAVLALIQRQADLVRDHAALDPKTVASLRGQGADILVRSTLRPFMRSYQLRVMVIDVRTGKMLAEEAADFEAQFKTDLDAITGS